MRFGREIVLCLLLAALTVAALGVVVGNDFIELDDGEYITGNSLVRDGLSARGIAAAFTTTQPGAMWRPVTWLSHMLDVELFGMRAGGHHAVSLAIHTANTVLVFLLLHSLTGAPGRSALVAGLFGIHPLHVESVAWAAERWDVLSAFFALCCALGYGRAVRRNSVAHSVAPPLLFALALMSKTIVLTLPLLFLLLDWWPLNRWRPTARRGFSGLLPPAGLWLEKTPLLLLSAASVVMTLAIQGAGGMIASAIPAPLRVANACVAYVRYLGKAVWPQGLSVFYPYPFKGIPAATIVVAAALLAAVSTLAVRQAGRRPCLIFGWLWFLGTLAPVVGVLQAGGQAMADRYTYLPLTGVFVAAVWGAGSGLPRGARPALLNGALAVALLFTLAGIGRAQAALWRDTRTLFTRALELDPGNWVAWTALGTTCAQQGRWEEAIGHFKRSVTIMKGYFYSNHNLGVTLAGLGRLQEALPYLQEAAGIVPGDLITNEVLGRTLLNLGRPEEALGHLRTAVALDPGRASSRADLGAVLAAIGLREEAVVHLGKALEIEPRDAGTQLKLGETLFELGRQGEAIVHLQQAVALDPANPVALNNLGAALAQSGRLEEAEAAFRRAVALDGRSADARLNLGLALLDLGRLEAAASELLEAAALDPAHVGVAPALARLRGQRGGEEAYAGARAASRSRLTAP